MSLTIEQLEQKITDNDRFYQQRYEADQRALAAALAANEKRLDGMNEFRMALSDQSARMMPRVEIVTMLDAAQERGGMAREQVVSRLEGQIAPLTARMEQIGRPNWALMASFASVIAVLLTGLFLIIGLKIDTSATPMALSIEQVKTVATGNSARISSMDARLSQIALDLGVAQQSLASFRSVQVINSSRITNVEDRISNGMADRKAAQAAIQAKLTEIETQFRAVSTVINLMKDDNHQMFGVLWSRTFPGVPLPAKTFRPMLYDQVRPNQ